MWKRQVWPVNHHFQAVSTKEKHNSKSMNHTTGVQQLHMQSTERTDLRKKVCLAQTPSPCPKQVKSFNMLSISIPSFLVGFMPFCLWRKSYIVCSPENDRSKVERYTDPWVISRVSNRARAARRAQGGTRDLGFEARGRPPAIEFRIRTETQTIPYQRRLEPIVTLHNVM